MPPDPAANRGDTPEFPYRQEAAVRMKEAAICLRRYLEGDPRRLDMLDDFEVLVCERFGQRGALATADRKLREIARAEREIARRNRPKRAHPTRPSVSLDAGWESFE